MTESQIEVVRATESELADALRLGARATESELADALRLGALSTAKLPYHFPPHDRGTCAGCDAHEHEEARAILAAAS